VAAVLGNAVCTDEDRGAGLLCDGFTGQHCTLPCILGPGSSTLQGLPGDPYPGYVIFFQDEYFTKADDPDRLALQTSVLWEDLCDFPLSDACASFVSMFETSSSVAVSRCDDDDPCTMDLCEQGECRFDPVTCDDDDNCTEDACDPDTGVCTFVPRDPLPAQCLSTEGCDATFWARAPKSHDRLGEEWWPGGLNPDSDFCQAFDYDNATCPFPGDSLMEVLKAHGSSLKDLGRQAVAAPPQRSITRSRSTRS